MTNRSDVLAEIYNLSAQILLGKASKEDIERVTKLAKEFGCLDELRREFVAIGQKLTA